MWSIADYFGRERAALLAAFERAEVSGVGAAEAEADAVEGVARLGRTESAFAGGARPIKQRCVANMEALWIVLFKQLQARSACA